MTAHVVYSNIDSELPATLSTEVIRNVIRKLIKFDGLIMTDDISMKALSGDKGKLSIAALEAGCNLVLHCNGDMVEMNMIAKALEHKSYQIDLPDYMMLKSEKYTEFNIHESTSRLHDIMNKFSN